MTKPLPLCGRCGAEIDGMAARMADGSAFHRSCASLIEQRAFLAPETKEWNAYLSLDGMGVQTWPGGLLARVVKRSTHDQAAPQGGRVRIFHVWARDDLGRTWYGRGLGPGMAIRLRRVRGGRRA